MGETSIKMINWGAKLEFDHMKMQPDRIEGANVISRHEPGRVWVNAQTWSQNVIVPLHGEPQPWTKAVHADLSSDDFEQLLALRPEIVIFGSGPSLRFVPPALHRALFAQRVGIETMDTAAACRTYNVLASEGRAVVAALLLS